MAHKLTTLVGSFRMLNKTQENWKLGGHISCFTVLMMLVQWVET